MDFFWVHWTALIVFFQSYRRYVPYCAGTLRKKLTDQKGQLESERLWDYWNGSGLQDLSQIAMASLLCCHPPKSIPNPLTPHHPLAILPPFLPPKLNDRWQKSDQHGPSSRKHSHLKRAHCPLAHPRATAHILVRLFGVYVHVHKSARGWGSRATMDTEASEGEDGGVLGV